MKFFIFAILLSSTTFAYTAKTSTEAILKFSHWVELPDSHSPAAAKLAIQEQVEHIFGPLSVGKILAAPKLNDVISNMKVLRKNDGSFIASYTYQGTIVLKNGPTDKIRFALPNNPSLIWETSEENKKTQINPCTDEHYQSKGDFWYFWSPLRPGCSKVLKEGRDFTYVTGLVKRIPNMTLTYPEYERLPDEKGRIQITLIMGKDEPNRIRSPYNRRRGYDDLNAINFRKIARELKSRGFSEREWTNEEVKAVVRRPLRPYPFVLEYNLPIKGPRARELVVQMVYTNVDLGSQSNGFHYFLEYALENSAVTIYDGHSGLGANLDMPSIRQAVNYAFKFNLNKSRYQIFFFSSCTSYAYYNENFFAKKVSSQDPRGSKNLDVLTSGMETAFEGSVEVNMTLIRAIGLWASTGQRMSYQQLASKMENMDNLFGVNGDEDNPKR